MDKTILEDILLKEMPFGKFKGRKYYRLPTYYLEWMQREGFPQGRTGMILSTMYEIRINGLDDLLKGIKRELNIWD